MNEKECKELFPDANRCFSNSSQFPPEALKDIPSELHDAIDKGNIAFFDNLKHSFPIFYEVLTTKCSDITLLEITSINLSLNNFGKERLSYYWGFKCNDKYIEVHIPVSNPSSEIARMINQPYLDALPKEFESFYEKMGGIGINQAHSIPMITKDLPPSFSDFFELEAYLENTEQNPNRANKFYTDFSDADIRVFIECTNGDLILCNLASNSRNLYMLKANSEGEYRIIENPIKTLDTYFAQMLLQTKKDNAND